MSVKWGALLLGLICLNAAAHGVLRLEQYTRSNLYGRDSARTLTFV